MTFPKGGLATPDFQAIQVIARTSEHKAALVSIKEKANEFFYLSSIRRRFLGELRFKGISLHLMLIKQILQTLYRGPLSTNVNQ